jgi:2-C-methyl-D-erythritol 4-phosphate cytidylyltransferase
MRANAIIVAAGAGARMGGGVPKPFIPLLGRALILHTLERFLHSRTVSKVIVVVSTAEMEKCQQLVRRDPLLRQLNCSFQAGGRRRQDSVAQGLTRLEDCDVVAVHDGARPFVSPGLIDRCVDAARTEGAVVVGLRVKDTVKIVTDQGLVRATPARQSLWQIQTPQAFQTEIIREAYRRAAEEQADATDDSMLVEKLGHPVRVLEGEETNIKITVPQDLLIAEALLRGGRIAL